MRSLFASLALALAPRLLTYTQTPAQRPPHALPGSQRPAPPKLRQPEQRCPARLASPSAHSRPTSLAHRPTAFAPSALTGASQSPRSSPSRREISPCFSSPLTDSLPSSSRVCRATTLGMGTPPLRTLLLPFQTSLSLGCTWQEIGPRTRTASPDQGLGGLVPPHAPGPLPHPCRLPGRTGCLPPLQS